MSDCSMDPNCANKRCLGLKGRGDPPPMWLQTTTERDVRVVVDKELIAGEIEVGDAITIKKGRVSIVMSCVDLKHIINEVFS